METVKKLVSTFNLKWKQDAVTDVEIFKGVLDLCYMYKDRCPSGRSGDFHL